MMYEELVKALRCMELRLSCNECEYGVWSESGEAWGCEFERKNDDAAAAIEELQADQKKTVTQIFGEEQMAWEGRCKDLMKYISALQAEVKDAINEGYNSGYTAGIGYCSFKRAKMEVQDESAGSL